MHMDFCARCDIPQQGSGCLCRDFSVFKRTSTRLIGFALAATAAETIAPNSAAIFYGGLPTASLAQSCASTATSTSLGATTPISRTPSGRT